MYDDDIALLCFKGWLLTIPDQAVDSGQIFKRNFINLELDKLDECMFTRKL